MQRNREISVVMRCFWYQTPEIMRVLLLYLEAIYLAVNRPHLAMSRYMCGRWRLFGICRRRAYHRKCGKPDKVANHR